MSNAKWIVVPLAALSLSAAYTVWLGRPSGPGSLVVLPRQYVGLMPGTTRNFTAKILHNSGEESDVSAAGTAWTCSPSVGTNWNNTASITGAVPSYGWVQAACSGLTTRVYVKVSADGAWNPDEDYDGDGFSDAAEITSNTQPAAITLRDVRAKLSKVLQ